MSVDYRSIFNTRVMPQNQPILDAGQSRNNAGGFAWQVDDWTQLERFLILGSEGGTFYVGEQKLTVDNAQAVVRCIQADGLRVVAQVVDVSRGGKAAKNDPALFVLALVADLGDLDAHRAAMAALPGVARTGPPHIPESGRCGGRAELGASPAQRRHRLVQRHGAGSSGAYQAVKYQQRDGWSHWDALRLVKPVPASTQHNAIFGWIAKGWSEIGGELPGLRAGQAGRKRGRIRSLVRKHG